MSNGPKNALVPVRDALPVRARVSGPASGNAASGAGRNQNPFDLVASETSLNDRAQVERFLPDILGRALARAWIDRAFRAAFASDPVRTLAAHRIRLPKSIRIEVVTEGHTRPLVVVSEEGPAGTAPQRLLYLQLVMVAGK